LFIVKNHVVSRIFSSYLAVSRHRLRTAGYALWSLISVSIPLVL